MLIDLAVLAAAALLALSLVAVPLARRPGISTIIYGASIVPSTLAMLTGIAMLVVNDPQSLTLPLGLPWLGSHLRLDALAAVFLVVVGLGGAMASLFAIGYGRHEAEPWRVLPFFSAFIGAMILVVLADDAYTFLLSWELMSILSWALVLTNHRDAAARHAGLVYIVMAGFGTIALLLAFGLLAGSDGGYGFEAIRAAPRSSYVIAAVLALALLGAGSKAGLEPLHVWLPLAHPAAPSHVSALMSGVMTKVAIYGFIRIAFDLMGAAPWWMALIVLLLGGITAVMGVMQALMEHDLKRLLAYHTVENIGIIFIGIGLAMAFRADGMVAAAALALTAALFHVFNHSVFKSLLFFGSGAILGATGTRDMEKMGGLIHRMPVTAVVFLVGCVAISALPPFNGFVSEWLTFQAILLSPDLSPWGLKFATPAVGGLLALAAALAATCFVKVYGVVFLGRARSDDAGAAVETDRFSLGAMGILAALSLLAGVMPGIVIDALSPVTQALVGGAMPVQSHDPMLTITPIAASRSSYNGMLVLVFITLSASLSAWAVHRFASRRLRRAPAWDCGFPNSDPITQYSAGSFAQPVRRVLGSVLLRAREEVTMPPPGDPGPAHFRVQISDLVWEWLYAPIARAVAVAATWLNRLQFLSIRRYLGMVMASLIFMLVVLTKWT